MYIYIAEEYGRFIHSFIHSFIHFFFAINQIQIRQQYTEIYSTLEIIYTILTKLFTKLDV